MRVLTKESERISKETIDMNQHMGEVKSLLERTKNQEKKNNLIVKGFSADTEDEEKYKRNLL